MRVTSARFLVLGADIIGEFLVTVGNRFPHHGTAAFLTGYQPAEQIHGLSDGTCPGVQFEDFLDNLIIQRFNNRLMAVFHDGPFRAGLVNNALDLVAGRGDAALFQCPDIDRVLQNTENHTRLPPGFLFDPERGIIMDALLLLILHRRGNAPLVQTGGNVIDSQTVNLPPEDVSHHIGGIGVRHQLVMVLRVLLVSVGRGGTDEVPPAALDFQQAPYLDRSIAAVSLIEHMLIRKGENSSEKV